jgi:hypothetical protein
VRGDLLRRKPWPKIIRKRNKTPDLRTERGRKINIMMKNTVNGEKSIGKMVN